MYETSVGAGIARPSKDEDELLHAPLLAMCWLTALASVRPSNWIDVWMTLFWLAAGGDGGT